MTFDYEEQVQSFMKNGMTDEAARRAAEFMKRRHAKGESAAGMKFDEKGRLIIAENAPVVFEGTIEAEHAAD